MHACILSWSASLFCSSSSTSLAVGLYSVSICFSLKSLEVLFPKALKSCSPYRHWFRHSCFLSVLNKPFFPDLLTSGALGSCRNWPLPRAWPGVAVPGHSEGLVWGYAFLYANQSTQSPPCKPPFFLSFYMPGLSPPALITGLGIWQPASFPRNPQKLFKVPILNLHALPLRALMYIALLPLPPQSPLLAPLWPNPQSPAWCGRGPLLLEPWGANRLVKDNVSWPVGPTYPWIIIKPAF